MLKIGNVEPKNNVVLAPMAGVCNPAFRLIAKEFGCGLVCAEMVSDKAILHGNKRTMKMLYVDEREKPLSLQIFGGDKRNAGRSGESRRSTNECRYHRYQYGLSGAESDQMRCRRQMAARSEQNLGDGRPLSSMPCEKPVTVKMRIGWDDEHIYAVENAQAVERAGGQGGQRARPHARAAVYRYARTGRYYTRSEAER